MVCLGNQTSRSYIQWVVVSFIGIHIREVFLTFGFESKLFVLAVYQQIAE